MMSALSLSADRDRVLGTSVLAGAMYMLIAHNAHKNAPSNVVSRERELTVTNSTFGVTVRQSGMQDGRAQRVSDNVYNGAVREDADSIELMS